MTPMHRVLGGLAGAALLSTVSLAVAGGAQASTGAPVAAAASTAATYAEGEFQCGPNNWIGALVPENPPGGADFHDACVQHDRCYDTGSTVDRRTCDTAFLRRMLRACDTAGAGWNCDGVAYTYYGAVRSVGWSFYKGSGANT